MDRAASIYGSRVKRLKLSTIIRLLAYSTCFCNLSTDKGNLSIMRLLPLLLLASVQSLAITQFASAPSLSGVLPSNANISSNKNVTSNSTQPHNDEEVLCRVADPLFPYSIEVEFCGPAISIACRIIRAMAASQEGQGDWNWVTLTPGRKCVAAFYVPPQALPSMFPSLDYCHHIFEHILDVCGRNRYVNVGTINVDSLPYSFFPGTAERDDAPRYLMASKHL